MINGKIGSFSIEVKRAHTVDHPPILRAGLVKADNGTYPAGLIVMRNADGELVPFTDAETDTPVGVVDEQIDTAEESACMYLVHGTVLATLLKKGEGLAAELDDQRKLETIGIYAV